MHNYAKPSTRIGSVLIDLFVFYTLLFLYLYVFGSETSDGTWGVEGVATLPVLLLWLVYFPIVEGLSGTTLGKLICGIRVVQSNGKETNFGVSFIRHLFDIVDIFFFGIVGVLVMTNSKEKQRVGDLVAKTYVIGNRYSTCSNCRQQVILTPKEMHSLTFDCPHCGEHNEGMI